jgi:hypothetical protein
MNEVEKWLETIFDAGARIYNLIVRRPIINTAILFIGFTLLSALFAGLWIVGPLFATLSFLSLVALCFAIMFGMVGREFQQINIDSTGSNTEE